MRSQISCNSISNQHSQIQPDTGSNLRSPRYSKSSGRCPLNAVSGRQPLFANRIRRSGTAHPLTTCTADDIRGPICAVCTHQANFFYSSTIYHAHHFHRKCRQPRRIHFHRNHRHIVIPRPTSVEGPVIPSAENTVSASNHRHIPRLITSTEIIVIPSSVTGSTA